MATETRPFEILLAEDSEGDAELVREGVKLHHIDCSLHLVSDGARAIEFINRVGADRKVPPLDLLLLDLRLPICDGDEVLTRRRSSECYAHTPVIIMTARGSSAVGEKTSRHDATLFFETPSPLEEFLQLGSTIRRAFEQRKAEAGYHGTHGGAV